MGRIARSRTDCARYLSDCRRFGEQSNHLQYRLLHRSDLCSRARASISWVAKKLDLVGPQKDVPHHSIELISMGKAAAEMVQFQTSEESALVGQKLKELTLPNHSNINAIIRDNQVITPMARP